MALAYSPDDTLVELTLRSEWLKDTERAFDVLAAALAGGLSFEHVQQAFARISNPQGEAERGMFRCFLSELLLDAVQFGRSVARRDALDAILRAWHSIRPSADPVAALRHAVDIETDSFSHLPLAERVGDLLDRRYAERLRLQDLADELGVSESKMKRAFRLAYGSTVHRHLLAIRVRRGLELVQQGMKIEAAALAVGFKSKTSFYNAVQRFVGCTPGQVRSRRLTQMT